jgi:hypothetical protein
MILVLPVEKWSLVSTGIASIVVSRIVGLIASIPTSD